MRTPDIKLHCSVHLLCLVTTNNVCAKFDHSIFYLQTV